MSNFLNKIPVSPITSFGSPSVPNGSTIGTNFSILQTGGYMEIYSLSGLTYTIPPATTGVIEFSGNSIPIQFTKGTGSSFSPDVLILNSDNISSGRRKLGMLVYVYETNKIYQFKIDNYNTLWNNATGATGPGGATVVISDYGTTVKNNSPEGVAFINVWTASTVSGVDGYNDTNSSWRVLQTFTGGTVTGATNFTNGLTANTISATTYLNLPIIPQDYLPLSGGTVTGATNFIGGLSANTISATTYYNLPKDVFITGGTYFQGNTIFTNSTGDTFNIFGPSNYDPGVISGNTIWTSNGNGSMNLPQITVALFDNPNFFEPLKFYSILSGTTGVGSIPALINNDTNYIIIEYNNGVPRYNVLDNDGTVDFSSVILYMIVYRADNFVHVLEFGNTGSGLPSKLNERLVYTNRFARESGCGLGLSGSTGVVTLSSGVVWNGTDREVINDTTSLGIFFRNFHSGGTWVYTTTAHTINNLYYDDGTNLISATAGKYLVNWYFRGQELNDHLYEVVSNGQFDNILLADASSEPSLPELITSHAFLVGRIIIEVSATTGITQSAFSSVFQPSGAPGVHNDLTNIQGGLPNQYYHLDSNKYNNLVLTNIDNNFSAGQTFASGLTATTISATTYTNVNHNNTTNLQGGQPSEYYHLTSSQLTRVLNLIYINNVVTFSISPTSGERGVSQPLNVTYRMTPNDDIYTGATINPVGYNVLPFANGTLQTTGVTNSSSTTAYTLNYGYTRNGSGNTGSSSATYTAYIPQWVGVSVSTGLTSNTYASVTSLGLTKVVQLSSTQTATLSATNQYVWFISNTSGGTITQGGFTQSIAPLNVYDGTKEFQKNSVLLTLSDGVTTSTVYTYRTTAVKNITSLNYQIT